MFLNTQARANCDIDAFIDQLKSFYMLDKPWENSGKVDRRRKSERLDVTFPVIVTSLDERDGVPSVIHHAISRNISCEGIGLVMSNPVGREEVNLTFNPSNGIQFDVVARVAYCNELGFYFYVGMEFEIA